MTLIAATPPTQALGWDCHCHLFGPYARYPLAAERSYTPPEALQPQLLALWQRLGLSHGVLVHPSAYGDDFGLFFDALAALPQLRGVIVAQPGTLPTLQGLRERGVRAARFMHRSGPASHFAGSASFEHLLQMAPALADAGLHAELWTDCGALPALAAQIEQLPVPVVIDHMAMFDWQAGVDEPGFACLRDLLARGKVWVKLCAYRNLLNAPTLDTGRAFQQALQEANPTQLVWGSDWPHLRVTPEPDAAVLLQAFKDWAGDAALVRQVLVDNPGRLYG